MRHLAYTIIISAILLNFITIPTTALATEYSIEEVYAHSRSLAGQTVRVHGDVVKFTEGILGSNWIRLQDGTEDVETNTLIIITKAQVAVGNKIVTEGRISVDKDFGAGYVFDVIMENAVIISSAAKKIQPKPHVILAIINSDGYSYIHLKKGTAERWIAVPQTEVKVGDRITFEAGMDMENYTSKALNRSFKEIQFCAEVKLVR